MCEDIISPLLEVLGMICSFLPVHDVAALEMVSYPFAHLDVDQGSLFFVISLYPYLDKTPNFGLLVIHAT